MLRAPALLLAAAVVVSACGGSDNTSSSNTMGASTGGAEVRVASAAQLPVTVRAAQDSAGAPPLPQGALEPLGAIQQFTPMGLTAPGLSIAVPFNPQLLDSGAQPRLLVAQPGGEWTLVADARVETQGNTSLLVADVPQLGYAVVVQVPAEAAASSADGKAKSAGTSVRITSGQPLVSMQLQSSQPALAPQPEGADLFRVGQPTTLVQSVRVDFNTACAPQVRVYGVLAKMVGDQLNTHVFTLASRAFPVGSTSAAFTATHTLDAAHNGSYATFASATCTRTVGGSWANQVLSRVPAVALGQYFDVNVQAPVAVPQITLAPQNASVTEGSTASFSVAATSAAPLAYQWQRSANGSDWTNVANATGSSLSLTATLVDNGSLWRVVVSNASGQATSTPAQLSVTQQLIVPSISSQPQNQTVVEGQNASFSVAASGQPAPSIQWQTRMLDSSNTETGWTDIPGATQASYTTPATTQADHQRQFRARISNSAGSLNSAAATLSVSAKVIAPSITQQPVGAEVIEGASADFTVAASGSTPLSYQWFKDGVALVGANGAMVSIPTGAADAGKTIAITVRVSNRAGQVTSQAASLVVTAADTGTVSGLINAGEGGSLSTANGVATLDVPAGALSANTTLTLKTVSPAGFTLPEGATPVGEVIVVGPAGTVFSQPVGISIPTPEDIPDGFALAIIELPEPSGARASGQKARAAGARVRAQATAGNVFSCLPPQAAMGGFTYTALSKASQALFVQVPSEACSAAAALLPLMTQQSPSDTQLPCSTQASFKPVDPTFGASYESVLHSRHVACGEMEATFQSIEVPVVNDGVPSIDGNGRMDLRWKWSIYGPSNKLSKKIKVTLTYTYIPQGFVKVTASPTLNVRVVSQCEESSGEVDVTCDARNDAVLTSGSARDVILDVPISWQAPDKIVEFRPQIKIYYLANGKPIIENEVKDGTQTSNTQDLSDNFSDVVLRCDKGQVWGTESGCVFRDAAAVLVLKGTPASAQHMKEAWAANPDMAGQYLGMKPYTRAVVVNASAPYTGLQRIRVASMINWNRQFSQKQCKEKYGPPAAPETCPIITDPDTDLALGPCDCDEFPFASTHQGSAMPDALTWGSSVKRIDSGDNRRAGAQLGAFYRKERIFDPYDEKRWPYDPEYVVNRFAKDETGRVSPVEATEIKHDQRFYIMFR